MCPRVFAIPREPSGLLRSRCFASSASSLTSSRLASTIVVPFNTTVTYDGLYAGAHVAPEPTATATLPATNRKCTCAACLALTHLTASATGPEELMPIIPV